MRNHLLLILPGSLLQLPWQGVLAVLVALRVQIAEATVVLHHLALWFPRMAGLGGRAPPLLVLPDLLLHQTGLVLELAILWLPGGPLWCQDRLELIFLLLLFPEALFWARQAANKVLVQVLVTPGNFMAAAGLGVKTRKVKLPLKLVGLALTV